MREWIHFRRAAVGMLIVLLGVCAASATPVHVEVRRGDAGWQLLRGGEAYFIKGAGGDASKKLLAEAGGNSFRTWAADNIEKQLDEAQALGLTVCVGIWLGQSRQGFSYNNSDQVAEQTERVRQTILKYKNHPAVLLWALGNEVEGDPGADNAAIWSAINNLASLAKRLDPDHPTMTVLAEIGGDKVKNVHRLCPDIDIVGINSYAGIASLPQRYKAAGGTKPYIVTEFGPGGVWETGRTSWGAAPELTSTEKGEAYRAAYVKAIAADKGMCLGGYAFVWGSKQEATATWFGMFLPDGSRLAAVDAMTELWSGKPPANRCPEIKNLKLDGADQVAPGQTLRATVSTSDPENDPLAVTWALLRDSANFNTGGDAQAAMRMYADAIVKSDGAGAELKIPKDGGAYRLYVFARDGKGGAAVANVPLKVSGPEPKPVAMKTKLPLIVFGDVDNPPYSPSGYMGNHAAIVMDEKWATNPKRSKTCLKCEYRGTDGWGGVVWQDPPNDWGDQPGGRDLTGATKLTFWARGNEGGEKVKFGFGILGADKKFHDTASGELAEIELTTDWKQYTIDLAGKDLSYIKTGFFWTLASRGKPITFHLDDIRYE